MSKAHTSTFERGSGAGARLIEDDLLTDIRSWVPELRARHSEPDRARRIPQDYVEKLQELGVLGLATPAPLGGADLSPDAIVDVAIELGRGCGATAWCAGNWTVHNLLVTMFPVEGQREVFSTEAATFPVVATGFSPARATTKPTDGGTVLNGQWDFVSGIDNSEWLVVVAIGDAGPMAHLLRQSDVTIIDTWHTAGLRGTGSHDVTAADVFVPDHRLLSIEDLAAGRTPAGELYDSPFLKLPLFSWFGCGILGSIIGMSHGALDVFTETTTQKVGGLSGIKVATRPEIPLRIGEAAAAIDAATIVARASFADMRSMALSGREVELSDRVRWRRDHAWSALTAATAVDRLYRIGGAHVLFDDDPLQQFYRDINAASHHYSVSPDILFGGWGKIALGLDPEVPAV